MAAKSPDGVIKEIRKQQEQDDKFEEIIDYARRIWKKYKGKLSSDEIDDVLDYIEDLEKGLEEGLDEFVDDEGD